VAEVPGTVIDQKSMGFAETAHSDRRPRRPLAMDSNSI
jgi:hypothetical protein